jgi:hypothetical protein
MYPLKSGLYSREPVSKRVLRAPNSSHVRPFTEIVAVVRTWEGPFHPAES